MSKVLNESYVNFYSDLIRMCLFKSYERQNEVIEALIEKTIYKAEDAREIVALTDYFTNDLPTDPHQRIGWVSARIRLEDEIAEFKKILVLYRSM